MDRGSSGNSGRLPSLRPPPPLSESAPPCSDDPRFSSHTRRTPVKLTRYSRPTRTATIAIASAAAGIALAVPGLAVATHSGQDVPAPPANPTRASQIQNIDQVKTAIKAYYGDTPTTVNDPVPNGADTSFPDDSATVPLHQFNPDGA